jgi:hypothetical protein
MMYVAVKNDRIEFGLHQALIDEQKRRKRSKPMGLLQTAERRTRKRNADLKQASGGGRGIFETTRKAEKIRLTV